MNRRLRLWWIGLSLFLFIASNVMAAEHPERQKAQTGVGKSLMGLQEGVRGVVGGFFGIGEHTAKFLFYGTRDGLRTMGRGAKKTDKVLQKKLW